MLFDLTLILSCLAIYGLAGHWMIRPARPNDSFTAAGRPAARHPYR